MMMRSNPWTEINFKVFSSSPPLFPFFPFPFLFSSLQIQLKGGLKIETNVTTLRVVFSFLFRDCLPPKSQLSCGIDDDDDYSWASSSSSTNFIAPQVSQNFRAAGKTMAWF